MKKRKLSKLIGFFAFLSFGAVTACSITNAANLNNINDTSTIQSLSRNYNNNSGAALTINHVDKDDIKLGIDLKSPNVPQILPSLWIDDAIFGKSVTEKYTYNDAPNKKKLVIALYKFFGKDIQEISINDNSPVNTQYSFNANNLEGGYMPGLSIYTKKLLTYRYEWEKQGANVGLDSNTADWSKKSEDYYNARKELNELEFIYNEFVTDHSNKIFDNNNGLIDQTLYDEFKDNNVLIIHNNNNGSNSTYIIKFRFSHTSGLDINNLEKYIEITHDRPNQANGKKTDWTLRFNLQKMKNDLGGLDWLTNKKFVFDLNGLHDFFDVTYQTFWEKVLGILDDKGFDTTGLTGDPDESNNKNSTFKKDNVLTTARSVGSIINNGNNYLPNQKGWVTPVETNDEIDYLIFKSIGDQTEVIITPTKQVTDWTWLLIVLGVIIVFLLIIIIWLLIRNKKQGDHARYKV